MEAVAVLREDDIELGVMHAPAPPRATLADNHQRPAATNSKINSSNSSGGNTGKKGSYAGVQVLDIADDDGDGDDHDRPHQCIVATEMEVEEKTSSGR